MSLRLKFNLILIATTVIGLLAAGLVSWQILERDARATVQRSAEMLLGGALSVRKYTVDEIRPLLRQLDSDEFLPQTVPAYAASQVIHNLQQNYPEYSYKEAALNPTNPANRASDWEADIIEWFRSHPDDRELSGERATATGSALYISRPIRITNPKCLTCHGDPAAAPAAMKARYGTTNGFGWKLNEVIGAQVVSVPQTVQEAAAWRQFLVFMGSLLAIFLVVGLVLNILLYRFVTRPVALIAERAEAISTGSGSVEELDIGGNDEIGSLARSFNRMQRSLNNAVKLLNESMQ